VPSMTPVRDMVLGEPEPCNALPRKLPFSETRPPSVGVKRLSRGCGGAPEGDGGPIAPSIAVRLRGERWLSAVRGLGIFPLCMGRRASSTAPTPSGIGGPPP
jgi:hypothetical protein